MVDQFIKSINFLSGAPDDIYNGLVDVLVTLEGDDKTYWFEFVTPQALTSEMERKKKNFIEANYPSIVVKELTPLVMKEALESFFAQEENGFWFKLYYSTPYLTINDLDFIINRHYKEIETDEEKNED